MSIAHTPEAKTSRPSPPGRRFAFLRYLEGLIERMFILFCLYSLSIGPMYWQWLAAREVHGWKPLAAFYEPLRLLGQVFPLFGEWLNWYIRLWIG